MNTQIDHLREIYQESELRTIMSFDLFLEYYQTYHIEGLDNEIS